MIIIAIPKSMSTSLKRYLSRKHKTPTKTNFNVNLPRVEYWEHFRKLTNAAVEFTPKVAKKIAKDKNGVWKFHIPPTDNNLSVFRPYQKVVLLRDPNEVICSWRRTALKIGRPLHGLPFDDSFMEKPEKAWINRARDTGLFDELKRFGKLWKRNTKNTLIITYEELITIPTSTVNRVEQFFGLPESEKVVLPRENYSR